MADLSTKKDPLHLPAERPPYVKDTSGPERSDADAPPAVGGDADGPVASGVEKPVVHLDDEAVRAAEREGKGFQGSMGG